VVFFVKTYSWLSGSSLHGSENRYAPRSVGGTWFMKASEMALKRAHYDTS